MNKKRVFATIISAIVVGTICVGVWATNSVKPVMYGDLNNDKKIDLVDLLLLEKQLVGYDVDINELASDLNADGTTDLVDLLKMRRFLVGYLDGLGKTITINFDTQGGSEIEPAKVSLGTGLEYLPQTTKSGKVFAGWTYGDGLTFDTSTLLGEDTTVYANWK